MIPGSGRSPGGGHGNPLQYSCLENPTDRGAWVRGVLYPWGCKELDTTEQLTLSLLLFMLRMGFPGGASGKEHIFQCKRHKRHGFSPQVGNIPWKREWLPTPVFLSGESHGQRSLVGYSPWGCKRVRYD